MRHLFLIPALILPLICSCRKERPPVPVSIAVGKLVLSAPVFVADARGLFRKHGADVRLAYFTSGRDALASVLEGKNNLATVADFAVAKAVVERKELNLLATLSTSRTGLKIIARKAPSSAAELEGWRIAFVPDTTSDYFLDDYLIMNLVRKTSVDLVPARPEDMVGMLARGEVDAVSTWEPIASECRKQVGRKAGVLTLETNAIFWNLAGARDLKNLPIDRILQALIDADRYMREHPQEAIAIVARYTGTESKVVASVWDDYDFRTTLPQGLLLTLENEARWICRRTRCQIPVVGDFINHEPLQKIRPAAVTVISR